MARSLLAGLSTVIDQASDNGGELYWLFTIHENTDDDWTQPTIAFGTLTSYSLASTTVWTSRLLSVSDIDESADPFADPFAKIADMKVVLDHTSADLTATDYLGRLFRARLGHGSQMTLATSEIFFQGRIIHATSNKKDLQLTIRDEGELQDKVIGEYVKTGEKKWQGKIYPITYGDWTDENGYMPLIIENPYSAIPVITFDKEAWKQFDGLYLYDLEVDVDYRADADQYTAGANSNELQFHTDTGSTLDVAIGENDTTIKSTGASANISYYTSSGTDVPSATVIKIDDELILLTQAPVGSSIGGCERGYGGTTKTVHAAGATIYQTSEGISGLLIDITKDYYPKSYAGIVNTENDPNVKSVQKKAGQVQDIIDSDLTDSVTYGGKFAFITSQKDYSGYTFLDMNFENIGISGTVTAMYILCKVTSEAQIVTPKSANASVNTSIGISKDGDTYIKYTFTISDADATGDPAVNEIYNIGLDEFKITAFSLSGSSPRTGTISAVKVASAGEPAASGTLSALLTSTGSGEDFDYTSYVKEDVFEIQDVTQAISAGTSSGTFDNISSSPPDDETDREIPSAIRIADIGDLPTTRYSLLLRGDAIELDEGYFRNLVYRCGFRIDFQVSPLKFDFYARGKARKNPGGYFNGSSGDLMENPSSIIEDFIRTEVPGLSGSSMTESYFDDLYTDRSSWKLAGSIFSDMIDIEGLTGI